MESYVAQATVEGVTIAADPMTPMRNLIRLLTSST
jgi:hypothetical protein